MPGSAQQAKLCIPPACGVTPCQAGAAQGRAWTCRFTCGLYLNALLCPSMGQLQDRAGRVRACVHAAPASRALVLQARELVLCARSACGPAPRCRWRAPSRAPPSGTGHPLLPAPPPASPRASGGASGIGARVCAGRLHGAGPPRGAERERPLTEGGGARAQPWLRASSTASCGRITQLTELGGLT